jgi:MAP/microtubule affinity-regulating kinase
LIIFLSSLSRKSIRESGLSSTTAGGATGNNMSTMGGSMAASSSYHRPADLNNTNITTDDEAGITTNDNIATGGGGIGDIKPRSLRFTWSMKTTSSMDPADMMKEIRKVEPYYLIDYLIKRFFFLVLRFSI